MPAHLRFDSSTLKLLRGSRFRRSIAGRLQPDIMAELKWLKSSWAAYDGHGDLCDAHTTAAAARSADPRPAARGR
jgi:hypothetical protein